MYLKLLTEVGMINLKSKSAVQIKEYGGKRKPIPVETVYFLLAIPFILFVFVFSIIPLFGWLMAFVDYNPGIPLTASKFVGLKYFINLFKISSEFPKVMRNTLVFGFLSILTTPFPIILAILLNELRNSKMKRIYQTMTSLPNFTSWIIVYAFTFSFFSIEDGLVNKLLLALNLIKEPTNILGNVDTIWYVLTLLGIWKSVGWSAIIYLGAISSIDQALYEAAIVDGAGRFKRIWHITVPGIMPTFVILTFLAVGGLLNGASFDQVFVFHNGIVHDKIQTLSYYIYSVGLKNFNFSLSTAAGIFNTGVSLILLTVAGFISKRVLGRTII